MSGWRRRLVRGAAVTGLAAGLTAVAGPVQRHAGAQPAQPQVGWVDGRTDVWVQNLDPNQPATVRVDYYPMAGVPPLTAPEEMLQPVMLLWPGQSSVFRYRSPRPPTDPGTPGLPFGELGQYAVIVNSIRRVATLNHTVEPFTGAAVMYTNVDVAPEIVVPLMTRSFSRPADMTSIVSIQSTETNPMTTVEATVYSKTYFQEPISGQYDPPRLNAPVSRTLSAVNTGGSWMTDLSTWDEFTPFERTPPNRVLVGTVGWMRLRTPNAATRVGAEAFSNLRSINTAVSGYAGVPVGLKTMRYYLPLFRGLFDGITGLSIVNPDATRTARVRLTYFGSDLPGHGCPGQAPTTHIAPDGSDTIPVPPNENVVLYQLPGNAVAPANVGRFPLPASCFGSAMLEVTEGDGVVAMMHDVRVERGPGGVNVVRSASGYMPVRQEDAARRTAVPVVRHDSTRVPGARVPRVATGIQVMNVDPANRPANVQITFLDLGGNRIDAAASARVVGWRRAHTWWTGAVPGISDRAPGLFEGSAVIESDVPVAVVVSIATVQADSVTYNGFGAE